MSAAGADENPLSSLTPRELEILRWVAEAKSNWAVGQIVGCSEETVKKHLQRVYRKLGVENRMAAVGYLRLQPASGTELIATVAALAKQAK